MKLKHKQLGIELPIASDFVRIPGRAGIYYRTTGDSFIAHNDTAWEVVKEEVWTDVTADVDYCGNLAFAHRNASRIGDVCVTDDKGYRFRKVQNITLPVDSSVFVIERKQP
jgi:hypothetical protein